MNIKLQLTALLLLIAVGADGKQTTFIAGRVESNVNYDLLVKSFDVIEKETSKRSTTTPSKKKKDKNTKITVEYLKDIVKFLEEHRKSATPLEIALVHYSGKIAYKEQYSSYRYRTRVITFNESPGISIIARARSVDSVYKKLRKTP